jgi:hypothetical protein
VISTLTLCWWAFGLGSFMTEYHLLQLNRPGPRSLFAIIFGALFSMFMGPLTFCIRSELDRDGNMTRCKVFGITVYDIDREE